MNSQVGLATEEKPWKKLSLNKTYGDERQSDKRGWTSAWEVGHLACSYGSKAGRQHPKWLGTTFFFLAVSVHSRKENGQERDPKNYLS